MNDFVKVKEQYESLREQEKRKIISYLKNEGFQIDAKRSDSGKGKPNYTSGGRLKIEYDLSNWKWIEAKLNGVNFLISLQSFDKDPNSGNHHVLMDRIGVYVYEEYSPEDAFAKMVTTEIELPMDDDRLSQLADTLKGMT